MNQKQITIFESSNLMQATNINNKSTKNLEKGMQIKACLLVNISSALPYSTSASFYTQSRSTGNETQVHKGGPKQTHTQTES